MPTGQERSTIVRRAVRVAVAASAGFYPLLYGAGLPVMALYALFAPIAVGLLSPVPGSGRQRVSVMLRALPPALVLATLGTLLAVQTWAAVGGMLAVGFVLAFAAVGGPRPAGVAPGLQLFYILACFPPYAPGTLGQRLAGLTLGVLALAACELLLPDPPAASYRERLARALGEAASGAAPGGVPPEKLREAGARLRLASVPPAERPAGAGRTDRALEQGGRAVRRLLDQLATLAETPQAGPDPASAALLDRVSELCTTCARFLRTGTGPPVAGALEEAMRDFQVERVRLASGPPGERPPVEVLRRQSQVLALAESARMAEITTDIAVHGHPTEPTVPRRLFWYAELSTPRLWARRVTGNVTFRSVLFQNALRTALGLAAARAVAGSLDLSHGFWVLLAVLTLGRTTAGATWRAVRLAVAGNAAGALVAGALLIGLGPHTDAYAALLAPVMLVAFALGPLLGIAYAQGLFTLVVATAFAQIEPVTWRLSEARMIDVVTGSVIGLLCGLLAWPAGARREVHRAMAELLRVCAQLVPVTAQALLTPAGGSRAAPQTLPDEPRASPRLLPGGSRAGPQTLPGVHRLRLAEAAYAQYRTEAPGEDTRTDWHAMLIAANHMLLGAHWLPRFGLRPEAGPSAPAAAWAAAWARTTAQELVAETDRIASELTDGAPAPVRRWTAPDGPPPTPLSVDLEVWMTSLAHQLTRIESSLTPPPGPDAPPVTPSRRRTAPPD
ncbi:FUSC family protein [Streptomyces cyaneofuscatus]|uniref:FUSC family protein n=1 Tax=Streptomyces cyaneofuscatus TaxID=66883 RepID=A0ABZ1F742_9ACTN|nr:FUSC family protein [Streptomyces cyaneofuscatus]WSB12187.1 FUSC family protein [Streptomyces cyaneofuscatus]WSD51124.1 FUSC family protein [Streptomyces cyaneofuscatus]